MWYISTWISTAPIPLLPFPPWPCFAFHNLSGYDYEWSFYSIGYTKSTFGTYPINTDVRNINFQKLFFIVLTLLVRTIKYKASGLAIIVIIVGTNGKHDRGL